MCAPPRIHVRDGKPHLLLLVSTEESSKSPQPPCSFKLIFPSSKRPNPAIWQRADGGIPSTIATGSASRATSSPTTRTPRISTFLRVKSTFGMGYRPASRTRPRTEPTSPSTQATESTTSRLIARRAPKNGSRQSRGSFFGRTTTETASRSRCPSRTLSILRTRTTC